MRKNPSRRVYSSRAARPLLLGLFVLALAAAILIPLYLARSATQTGMGGSPPNTEAQLVGATPGSIAKIVLEVTSTPTNTLLSGTFLARKNDGSYSRTARVVTVKWNPNQSVIMGGSQDVHRGAVLQVSGHVDVEGTINADQVVILTNAITVH